MTTPNKHTCWMLFDEKTHKPYVYSGRILACETKSLALVETMDFPAYVEKVKIKIVRKKKK